MLMAAKVALAMLISLGLAIVTVATVRVVGAESATSATATALSEGCACGAADVSPREGDERREHLAWNAASWLVGLALVVAIGRRGRALADGSAS
jgi:hypothetical protein